MGEWHHVQQTNLQQLCDDVMWTWTKILEEYCQHLDESMSWKIKSVLKAKGVHPGASNVHLNQFYIFNSIFLSKHKWRKAESYLRGFIFWLKFSFLFNFPLSSFKVVNNSSSDCSKYLINIKSEKPKKVSSLNRSPTSQTLQAYYEVIESKQQWG